MKNNYLFKVMALFWSLTVVFTSLSQTTVYSYSGTYDTYTVPLGVTSISIEALGAQGTSANPSFVGGLGAQMSGDFAVTPGETLIIVVGGVGIQDGCNGGGGGGSFVVRESPGSGFTISAGPFAGTEVAPLIIAGGGGGCRTACTANGNPGVTTNTATTASGGSSSGGGFVSGTTPGNGGIVSSSSWGSGAGGFVGNGSGDGLTSYGGRSFLNGATGGTGTAAGGFGGGGAGEGGCGGGGGGGYTGGDGGYVAGGGGSFNIGTAQVNASGVNSGNGEVTISVNCSGLVVTVSDFGVCTGDPVTLSASSTTGGTVTWDMGVTDGVAFTPPTGATIYTATSTSTEDCGYSVEITSTDVPVIGIVSSTGTAACENELVKLYGTGGDTYSWDMGVINNVAFDPGGPGSYTYTVTGSLLGCDGLPASIDIDVADLSTAPTITASATPSEVCIGETFVLAGAGDAESYYWGPGVTDGGTNVAASSGTFVYNVVGEDILGCQDTATVIVTVNPSPTVSAGPDMLVCEGDDIILTASGADSYSWDNGVTDGVAFTALNVGVTTYTVTGTNAFGCTDTDVALVTVLDAPNATGAITHETTGFNGSIDLTVSGGAGSSYTYTWSHGPTTQDVFGLTAGTYTVIISDGACEAEYTFTVLNVLGIENNDFGNLNVYPNPTNDLTTIEYSGNFSYTVYTALGSIITTDYSTDKAIVDMTMLESGVYLVQIVSENGSKTVQVTKK